MGWMKIEQEKTYLICYDSGAKLEGPIYKDHLVVLKNGWSSSKQKTLYFFNLSIYYSFKKKPFLF